MPACTSREAKRVRPPLWRFNVFYNFSFEEMGGVKLLIRKRGAAPLIKRLLHLDIVSIDLSYGPEKANGAASLLCGWSCRALPLNQIVNSRPDCDRRRGHLKYLARCKSRSP